jgi:hypothetical protein
MKKAYVDLVIPEVQIDDKHYLFSDLGLFEDEAEALYLSDRQKIKEALQLKFPGIEVVFRDPAAHDHSY